MPTASATSTCVGAAWMHVWVSSVLVLNLHLLISLSSLDLSSKHAWCFSGLLCWTRLGLLWFSSKFWIFCLSGSCRSFSLSESFDALSWFFCSPFQVFFPFHLQRSFLCSGSCFSKSFHARPAFLCAAFLPFPFPNHLLVSTILKH